MKPDSAPASRTSTDALAPEKLRAWRAHAVKLGKPCACASCEDVDRALALPAAVGVREDVRRSFSYNYGRLSVAVKAFLAKPDDNKRLRYLRGCLDDAEDNLAPRLRPRLVNRTTGISCSPGCVMHTFNGAPFEVAHQEGCPNA